MRVEVQRLCRRQVHKQIIRDVHRYAIVSRETMAYEKTQEMTIHFLRFFHAEIPAASQPLHGRTWDTVFRGGQEMATRAGPLPPWKSGERLPLMISDGFWREFLLSFFRCTGEAHFLAEGRFSCIPPLKSCALAGNQENLPGPSVLLYLYSPMERENVPEKNRVEI